MNAQVFKNTFLVPKNIIAKLLDKILKIFYQFIDKKLPNKIPNWKCKTTNLITSSPYQRSLKMENVRTNGSTQASWTSHAILRRQQRGIKQSEADIVFNYGDREMPAGSNCYHLGFSKYGFKSLLKDKSICPKVAEKCKNLIVLTDGQSIITTFRTARLQ